MQFFYFFLGPSLMRRCARTGFLCKGCDVESCAGTLHHAQGTHKRPPQHSNHTHTRVIWYDACLLSGFVGGGFVFVRWRNAQYCDIWVMGIVDALNMYICVWAKGDASLLWWEGDFFVRRQTKSHYLYYIIANMRSDLAVVVSFIHAVCLSPWFWFYIRFERWLLLFFFFFCVCVCVARAAADLTSSTSLIQFYWVMNFDIILVYSLQISSMHCKLMQDKRMWLFRIWNWSHSFRRIEDNSIILERIALDGLVIFTAVGSFSFPAALSWAVHGFVGYIIQ